MRDNLHWLLVRHRIDYKICLLVYKCLHQLAALYLVSMISPVSAVSLHVAICVRQVRVTWLCHGQEQLASVHEAFQSLVR